MLECVPNVSVGRDVDVIAGLAAACGGPLLDVHTDADHNRSVFTVAAPDADAVSNSVQGLAREVATRLDRGARRRPPAAGCARRRPVRRTHRRRSRRQRAPRTSSRAGGQHPSRCPCSSTTAPTRNTGHCPLPVGTRSGSATPDLGPAQPHPELGATAVGVRAPLVAINCLLDTAAVEVARVADASGARTTTAGCPACARSASSSPRPVAPRSR